MAKMGGCNYEHESAKEAQGKGRVTPNSFSRNNMTKGGVNKHAGGTDTFDHKPKLSIGQNGQGKFRHDKR